MESEVNFVIPNSVETLSLSVFDSDSITNSSVMEQVVGTLVKYSGVGRYEPYLAKKWIVTNDQKVWTFEFNENLTTEDGILINAKSYADNLKKLLKIYSLQYSPPMFNKLKGWKEFVNNEKSDLGINIDAKGMLVLTFDETPSGVLEFLSMPYFGFYSPNDFIGEKWKDRKKVHSSASYRVVAFTDEKITLALRSKWPLANSNSPKIVNVIHTSTEVAVQNLKNALILLKDFESKDYVNFVKYNTTPTLMSGIVLSPYVYPFDSSDVRRAFRNLIRIKASKLQLKNNSTKKSPYFYNTFSSFTLSKSDINEDINFLKSVQVKKLKIFQQKLNDSSNSEFVMNVFHQVAEEINWELEIETPSTLGKDWIKIGLDNHKYAARTASVDIGGSPENWVIDMMFCSKLGISFPDYKNDICKIVKDFDSGKLLDKQEYWSKIHFAIEENSVVVPIIHSGFSWIISKNIDIKDVSTTMNIPRFDQLSLK